MRRRASGERRGGAVRAAGPAGGPTPQPLAAGPARARPHRGAGVEPAAGGRVVPRLAPRPARPPPGPARAGAGGADGRRRAGGAVLAAGRALAVVAPGAAGVPAGCRPPVRVPVGRLLHVRPARRDAAEPAGGEPDRPPPHAHPRRHDGPRRAAGGRREPVRPGVAGAGLVRGGPALGRLAAGRRGTRAGVDRRTPPPARVGGERRGDRRRGRHLLGRAVDRGAGAGAGGDGVGGRDPARHGRGVPRLAAGRHRLLPRPGGGAGGDRPAETRRRGPGDRRRAGVPVRPLARRGERGGRAVLAGGLGGGGRVLRARPGPADHRRDRRRPAGRAALADPRGEAGAGVGGSLARVAGVAVGGYPRVPRLGVRRPRPPRRRPAPPPLGRRRRRPRPPPRRPLAAGSPGSPQSRFRTPSRR